MKKIGKRRFLPFLAAVLICSMSMSVFASEDLPDLSRKGSISVTMKNVETEEVVPGGTILLCRVADAAENDGDYFFQYTETFAGCGQSLTDLQSETLASDLAAYATQKAIDGTVLTVGTDGTVKFENLSTGLYLIIQKSAAAGYNAAAPFLVSVPMQSAEGNGWIYDVDASPKMEAVTEQPSDPGTEDPGTDPENPGTDPENPGTDPENPGTDPENPGTDPENPGTDPENPGTNPENPGTNPENPGTNPENPGTNPENPGTNPGKPGTNPGKGSGTEKGRLPQTGQVNWPIPVMSIAGVLLFAAGWKLNHKNEEEQSEEQRS